MACNEWCNRYYLECQHQKMNTASKLLMFLWLEIANKIVNTIVDEQGYNTPEAMSCLDQKEVDQRVCDPQASYIKIDTEPWNKCSSQFATPHHGHVCCPQAPMLLRTNNSNLASFPTLRLMSSVFNNRLKKCMITRLCRWTTPNDPPQMGCKELCH